MQKSIIEKTAVAVLLLLGICGCNNKPQQSAELDAIKESFAQIAPSGGTGNKDYFYEDGKLKERVVWENHVPVEINYYDKSETLILTSRPLHDVALQISLSEDGKIKEIFQSKCFVKNGPCFSFDENGRLTRLEVFDLDSVATTIDFGVDEGR